MARYVEGQLPTQDHIDNARKAGIVRRRFIGEDPFVQFQVIKGVFTTVFGLVLALGVGGYLCGASLKIIEEVSKNPEVITNLFPQIAGIR